MNTQTVGVDNVSKKAELYELLRQVCVELDITETQYDQAKSAYDAVSEWLSASDSVLFKDATIYVHGSSALNTITKPISGDEFDVDLICFFPALSKNVEASFVKKLLGDRLREHERYAKILEEKKRCWRLNYAGVFHADIAPTIPNAACTNEGELVPDKLARDWKPTHPRGYRRLFDQRAALRPRIKIAVASEAYDFRAAIVPFPSPGGARGVLRRTVQLLKRHRDISFENVEADIKPISIIITTLAARSYEYVVNLRTYDTEFDVLLATVMLMPHFIERRVSNGKEQYVVENETTTSPTGGTQSLSAQEHSLHGTNKHWRIFANWKCVPGLTRFRRLSSKCLGHDL